MRWSECKEKERMYSTMKVISFGLDFLDLGRREEEVPGGARDDPGEPVATGAEAPVRERW